MTMIKYHYGPVEKKLKNNIVYLYLLYLYEIKYIL